MGRKGKNAGNKFLLSEELWQKAKESVVKIHQLMVKKYIH